MIPAGFRNSIRLWLSSADPEDCLCIYLDCCDQIVNRHEFICTMHSGVNAREHSSEGYAILQVMDVCAATDTYGLAFEAGHILICAEQLLHEV